MTLPVWIQGLLGVILTKRKVTPALMIWWVSTSVTAAVVRLLNHKHHQRRQHLLALSTWSLYPSLLSVFSEAVKPPNRLAVKIGALHQTKDARPPSRCVVTHKLDLVATRNAATCLARKNTLLKCLLPSDGVVLRENNVSQMHTHRWFSTSAESPRQTNPPQNKELSLPIDSQMQFHSPVKGGKGSCCVAVGSQTVSTSALKMAQESSSVVWRLKWKDRPDHSIM